MSQEREVKATGVFVKYSKRKPNIDGEYLCRFLTHLPVGLRGAEYLQYNKEEGGFMVEHNDYAGLEWFDEDISEEITKPESITNSSIEQMAEEYDKNSSYLSNKKAFIAGCKAIIELNKKA